MVEEKIGRRKLLTYAIYGIDTAIIEAAKSLDSDRNLNADCGKEITELSDIRKQIGAELKAMDAEINS